jgi:hypothetical protein
MDRIKIGGDLFSELAGLLATKPKLFTLFLHEIL